MNAERYMDFLEEFLWSIMTNFFPDGNFFSPRRQCAYSQRQSIVSSVFLFPIHWLLIISRSFESLYDIRNGFPRYC